MNMKPFANFAENMMQKSGRKSAAREASHEVGEQMGRSFREELTPSRAAKAASEKNDFGGYGYGYYQDHATYGNYNQGSAQNSQFSSYGDYNRAHQQSSSGYGGYNQGYQQSAPGYGGYNQGYQQSAPGYGGYNQGYQQSAPGYGGYNQGYQQSAHGYGDTYAQANGYGSQASLNRGSFGYPSASASSYSASSAGASEMDMWSRAYKGGDAEALVRAMAAEARNQLKYNPQAVKGVAYVIAQEAKKSGMTVEEVIKYRYPKGYYYLESFGEGAKGVNGMYYHDNKMPMSKIENYDKLLKIAEDALAGKDPTGIRPNHFYDKSKPAPKWANDPGVKKTEYGKMVFVHHPGDAKTKLP